MKKQSQYLILGAVIVLLLLVGAGSYFLGSKHAVESMTIKQITPSQAASAMQGDHFYSDYRENTLLIRGLVTSVYQLSGSNLIGFRTDSTFRTRCELSTNSTVPQVGATVRILTEGGSAQRQNSAVLLKNCLVL